MDISAMPYNPTIQRKKKQKGLSENRTLDWRLKGQW
jgi:hypothetical protein